MNVFGVRSGLFILQHLVPFRVRWRVASLREIRDLLIFILPEMTLTGPPGIKGASSIYNSNICMDELVLSGVAMDAFLFFFFLTPTRAFLSSKQCYELSLTTPPGISIIFFFTFSFLRVREKVVGNVLILTPVPSVVSYFRLASCIRTPFLTTSSFYILQRHYSCLTKLFALSLPYRET